MKNRGAVPFIPVHRGSASIIFYAPGIHLVSPISLVCVAE